MWVKVAAYQAPLLAAGSMDVIGMVAERVKWCEAEGVGILCCPEAVRGGLADYSEDPGRLAITAGELDAVLAPIASESVTTIVGFTEAEGGRLYNSAAVFRRGKVAGIYRKLHPAIRRSAYAAGSEARVFRVDGLTFGIVICNDSNFSEPARMMAEQGTRVLFVPSNNGLPRTRFGAEIVGESRKADVARAVENRVWVVRADVAGECGELVSYGSSGVVDPEGNVVGTARLLSEDLVVGMPTVVKV